MIELPDIVKNKAEAAGASAWVAAAPRLAAEAAAGWGLQLGEVMAGGTEALVIEVRRADGSPAVLKLGIPRDGDHLRREAEVLRRVGGDGCPTLLAYDEAREAILIERLGPALCDAGLGVAQRLEILADTSRRLWRPASGIDLPTGAAKAVWLIDYVKQQWERQGRPCSSVAVSSAIEAARRRQAAHRSAEAVLVHGDVHQWNALDDLNGGWKLVDPDGLVAEPAYDLGILMREDPVELLRDGPVQRARWLADRTGVDADPIWEWGLIERVSTGLMCLDIGLSSVGVEMLAAADAVAELSP